MNTQSSINQKAAFRPNEVSAVYGICKTKVYDLINDGTLQTVKVGRARLILRSSLNALITPVQAA